MNNQQERLQYLFDKYLSGSITDNELTEFWELVRSTEDAGDFPENVRAAWDLLPPRDITSGVDSDAILQQILKQHPGRQTLMVTIKRHWWKIAASLLMLLGIRLFTHKTNAPQPVTALHNAPITQHYGAILTLSNGEQIPLDSQTNGTIARQGMMQVLKHPDGTLSYTGSKSNNPEEIYNSVSTPPGSQYHLILPDGTGVWLNAASAIRYPLTFSGGKRKVDISGEAFLDVAHNTGVPFEVNAGDMQVQVLGTAFNIMAYKDEGCIKTTLVNGAVKVMKGGSSRQLQPGIQAILPAGENNFRLEKADMKEVLAWKEGEFRFYEAEIPSIMRQVARWYDVEIVYKGDIPRNKFYGVIPRQHSVSQLLEVLEMTHNVHFSITGRKIIVMPGPR